MLTTSTSLALLAYSDHLAIWHLAAASFLNGLGWATDNPVRRVMIGDVVGGSQMSTAMSLDVGANNASRMVGPTIGGLLLASVGIGGVFMLSVALYAFALYAAFRVRYRNTGLIGSAPVLARIAEGLRLVRSDRRLIGTLVVTMIYNVFGWPFTSMIPVIGQNQLGLGAEGIGILASMDGIGAFCGALLLTLFLRPALVCPGLSRRRGDLHGDADRVRSRAVARNCRECLVADRAWGRGVQHHASDAGLSRRAAGDAFAHSWRAVSVHRCWTDWVYRTRAAGRRDWSAMGHHGVGIGWAAMHGADTAALASHLN